ncbi:MAG: hypothetical protein GY870_11950, partial [archaeon]|nr:hypothetical protein [archaeon]
DDYSELINHVSEEFCPHVGCFFGKGDGGHGPTYKETVVANERDKSNLFKWSRVEDFYKEIEKYSDRFPVWNDELYLENHRGCFSNWAEVKRHNRKYENAIISYETLALMTSLSNPSYKYPMDRFDKLWKTTLVNQFHDILPGSSNIEVYDDCWEDWLMQDEILDKICADIGNSLGKDNSSDNNSNNNKNTNTNVKEIFLYNTVPWERKSRIFIPTTIFDKIPKLDKNGKPNYAKIQLLSDKINESNESNEYICQPISAESENTIDQMPAGWWTVVDLEGLSNNPAKITILDDIKSLELEKNSSFEISKDSISNDDISVKIDPTTGAMLELINNSVNDGKNLLKGNTSNLTFGFLDRSLIYPAWNLKRKYWKYPRKFSNNNPDIEISDNGPIFATIVINRITRKSPITQKITLFKDRSEVFLDYLADWKKKDFMLKVNYDTATEAEISTADMVYCAIERKTQPETPNDQARYEKFCHKYFDLSTPDKKWGIAMLNEGKYAFDTMGEKGNMRLTMLRSCRETFPEYHSWLKKERKYNKEEFGHKHSKYSGLGPFKCRYALLPHNGGALLNTDGSPNPIVKRRGDEFNMPVLVIPTNDIKVDGELNKGQSFLEILTPNVFLGTLKLNEWDKTGSIIARFVEGSGIPAQAEIKINPQITEKIIEIKAVDLLEREIENKFKWNKDTGILSFDMGKFEICTFELIM